MTFAAGVRDVLKPLDSWGVNHHTSDAPIGSDHFDFLIEGVPTLDATQEEANYIPNYHAASDTLDKVDIRELKLNTTLAALTHHLRQRSAYAKTKAQNGKQNDR